MKTVLPCVEILLLSAQGTAMLAAHEATLRTGLLVEQHVTEMRPGSLGTRRTVPARPAATA
jgi:hypothetical protein